MSSTLKINVNCYSGYKANERPDSFIIGKRVLKVERLLDTWYGPDYVYYKILADDENIYILKYNESIDEWDLDFFQDKKVKK